MTLTLDFHDQIFNSHILGMGRSTDLEWKRCELDTMLYAQWACFWATVHGKTVSFQSVGPWMGYSFTDLGAEGCCRSLNALLILLWVYRFSQGLNTVYLLIFFIDSTVTDGQHASEVSLKNMDKPDHPLTTTNTTEHKPCV